MTGFRVGLGSQILNTRRSPTAMVHAAYLMALASGLESFWVADHLNSLVPREIATPANAPFFGTLRLLKKLGN